MILRNAFGIFSVAAAIIQARRSLQRTPLVALIAGLRSGLDDGTGSKKKPVDHDWLLQISSHLRIASVLLPGRTDCFVRVIAADRILRRYGYQPEFFLQAGRDAAGIFIGHAFIKCDGILISGDMNNELEMLLQSDLQNVG